ncbi:MAG: DegT/DnrJ/EryC1/StrS family aminotransferase [Roseiflexaceae bacterium]
MSVPFNDLKRHHDILATELNDAIQRVMQSGYYILGPEVTQFESEFAAYCTAKHAIGVANGTDAIQLALLAVGVCPGDEVITVANAGVPGTAAIIAIGATPVFVDVDPCTRNLDPTILADAITPRTRAIMPVHLYGLMADMPAIMRIATQHAIPVVEDVAQAHGATLDNRVAGSIGDVAAFSFYPTKNLGAVGDGGAVVTNNDDIAMRVKRLRQYGWERKYYTTEQRGINSRLDELQAALLRVKLRHLEASTARRQEIAQMYAQAFATFPITLPTIPEGYQSVYHLYVIESPYRDALQQSLKQAGIGTDIHYPLPTHQQPVYQQYAPSSCLVHTERLATHVLSLPNFPELQDCEVDHVIDAVRQALSTIQ